MELEQVSKPRIYGVKILVNDGCYRFAFRHKGNFNLSDYDELDLEILSAKLVKRK